MSDGYRQTFVDGSPRGEEYLDDRTELAYVYDGLSLQAILYDRSEVERYRDTTLMVTLTEAGAHRMGETDE